MAAATGRTRCVTCGKEKATMKCGGCSQDYCINHITDHRQELSKQLDEIEVARDLFRQKLTEQMSQPQNHALIQQVNQWEHESIQTIQRAAENARQMILKQTAGCFGDIEVKLNKLTQQVRASRQENDFIETDLHQWEQQLTSLHDGLDQPSNIRLMHHSTPLVANIFIDLSIRTGIVDIAVNASWQQNGINLAGGNGLGKGLNQLNLPCGVCLTDDQAIYIADFGNHRIVEWRDGATTRQIVADGNGPGNRNSQLNYPTDVVIDKEKTSLIIAARSDRRVVRWPLRNGTSGETIISNVECWGLAMDNNGYLYVSDRENDEVRRRKIGDTSGTVVAGGNGAGNRLVQFSGPYSIFVDPDQSVYVSDSNNHRVMKWVKGAKEGIVVAGGKGAGNGLSQLNSPRGVVADQMDTIYVADHSNHRIMRWTKDATQGSVVVGGSGAGGATNQLNGPSSLSFDRQGNLFVSDFVNHRVQKFSIA